MVAILKSIGFSFLSRVSGEFRPELVHEAVGLDDFLHEGGKRLRLEGLAARYIGDFSGVKIHFNLVSGVDAVNRFGAFQDGKADVDGVPVKMRAKVAAMTQEIPAVLMASGACSRLEPQPKFRVATMMSPSFTFDTKSASISSIQWAASSFASEVLRYRAGIMTSVSTLSPYLNTCPCAFMSVLLTSWANRQDR